MDDEGERVERSGMPVVKLVIEIDGEQHEVELPTEALQAIRSIAEKNGLSVEDVITQAVVNESITEDLVRAGGKLLVEKDGKIRHLEYA